MENGKPARVSAELGEEKEATAGIAGAGLGAAERILRGGRPPYVPIKALGVVGHNPSCSPPPSGLASGPRGHPEKS